MIQLQLDFTKPFEEIIGDGAALYVNGERYGFLFDSFKHEFHNERSSIIQFNVDKMSFKHSEQMLHSDKITLSVYGKVYSMIPFYIWLTPESVFMYVDTRSIKCEGDIPPYRKRRRLPGDAFYFMEADNSIPFAHNEFGV